MAAMLLQGAPYAAFKEEWDAEMGCRIPVQEAVRLINEQTEIIDEALNSSMAKVTERMQCMAYMIEQCILLCSLLPCKHSRNQRRFRKVRRTLERARRILRGDGL